MRARGWLPACAFLLAGCSVTRSDVGPAESSYALAVGEDAALDRAVAAQLAQHPGLTGVYLVGDGLDAFAVRALTARVVERSLDVQYYIWHDDLTGRALASELLSAADRGVRVRVLLDDMDARPRGEMLALIDQHPNIEVRMFNPFSSRSGALRTALEFLGRGARLNRRMHNKSWIADGRVAVIGGRNIGDEYFAASEGVNFIDLDVALFGAAVAQVETAFDAYWNNPASVPIGHLRGRAPEGATLDDLRAKARASIEEAQRSPYAQRLAEKFRTATDLTDPGRYVWTSDVRVVTDDPRKVEDAKALEPGVLESMVEELRTTQSEALLISPYFVPGKDGTRALTDLARGGARVSVVTNSLAATDVAAVHSGYAKRRKPLLEGGVRLYEIKPSPAVSADDQRMRLGSSHASLHTKAVVVDRARVFVGSFNFDPRSASLNCEMGAWIGDASLAARVAEWFERGAEPEHSFTVSLDGDGDLVWSERLDGAMLMHDQDPYASWGRRATATFLSWLPIESQL